MANPVLDVITKGASAVNQASQITSQTLAQMDTNVARQAQVRQAYTTQMFNAMNTFQQAQMEENKLMVQKTFDVQNKYLDTLIKSNDNYMSQKSKLLDLDLKVEQMKQDKYYKEQALKLDKLKTNAMVEYYKAQTLKALGSNGIKKEPIPVEGGMKDKTTKDLLNKTPQVVSQSLKGYKQNLKGIVEFGKFRNQYKTSNNIDILPEYIKQNPEMKYLFDSNLVLKKIKNKDGTTTTVLNTDNKYLTGFLKNTFKLIGTGDLKFSEAKEYLSNYLNMLGVNDNVKNKITTNLILNNLKLNEKTDPNTVVGIFKSALANINLSNPNESRSYLKSASNFIKNNYSKLISTDAGKQMFEALVDPFRKLDGIPKMLDDEHVFNEVIQTMKGHDYDVPYFGYIGNVVPGAESLEATKGRIIEKFKSKKAFVGYMLLKANEYADKYGADPLKVIKEPTKDIGFWNSLINTFESSKIKLESQKAIDMLTPNHYFAKKEDEKYQMFRKEIPLEIANIATKLKDGVKEENVKQEVITKVADIVNKYDLYRNPIGNMNKILKGTPAPMIVGSFTYAKYNLSNSEEEKKQIKKEIINNLTNLFMKDAKNMLNNSKIKNQLASYAMLSDIYHDMLDTENLYTEQKKQD